MISLHQSCWSIFNYSYLIKDRNAPIMQQLSNAGMNNPNMGRTGGAAMNPVAVLQLLQSLQGLSQLAQLTSNLGGGGGGGLGPSLGGLSGGGGMPGVGGPTGMSDPSGANPLAALSGLGMLGNNLGLGGGSGGGLGPPPQVDSGTSGRQVFVRNVSMILLCKISHCNFKPM